MVARPVSIGGRLVGAGQPCFVIAEAGVNHDGSLERARQLVDVAAAARADAVKFQSFSADRVAGRSAAKAGYQKLGSDSDEGQREMLRRLELSPAAHQELQTHCRARGIAFLSTPFDEPSADLLDGLGVPAFKLASGELNNLPFVEYVARKGRPLILSTGMSTLEEVGAAVGAIRACRDAAQLVLLHCVSSYPTEAREVNLRAVATLGEAFDVPAGYSDHTRGINVSLAAAALGACVIEKHFTLDPGLPGPDHRNSLDPDALHALVAGVREVEAALGSGLKEPAASELENRRLVRRSLAAARDLAQGTRLTRDMLVALRPGTGIPPADVEQVVGRLLLRARSEGELIARDDLD